jgi:hypothetical protein
MDQPTQQRYPFHDLEDAVSEACALLELMADKLGECRETYSGDELSGCVASGIVRLSHESSTRLHEAFNAAHNEWRNIKLASAET